MVNVIHNFQILNNLLKALIGIGLISTDRADNSVPIGLN